MINKIECITIECDICGEVFEDYSGFSIWPDASSAHPEDHDWHVDGDAHYCPSCHTIDEDDNVKLKLKDVPGNDPGKQ